MNFLEHEGKSILAQARVRVPRGMFCKSPIEAADAVRVLGPSVVKAQVPTGKRGKAGGVRKVANEDEARVAAGDILSMTIDGYQTSGLLVEQAVRIAREFYAAVTDDFTARTPLVLFSTEGGMDIEEVAARRPQDVWRLPIDIDKGFDAIGALRYLSDRGLGTLARPVSDFLAKLYRIYLERDAELVEVNPLALLADGALMALDCKLHIDDAARYRQPVAAEHAAVEPQTQLESRGKHEGLKYMELDGNVGVLANGAGLTMTTMDVVQHFGGRAANFLEIGGDAYTKATPALELVLANPRVRSLVVNFCGAFARTDVMAEGVIKAWEALKPTVPAFFSIHGTGEDAAVRMLESRLGIIPFNRMEDAVRAAVEAAR